MRLYQGKCLINAHILLKRNGAIGFAPNAVKKVIWASSWYDPGCQGYACPYYSTNIQAAWLIIEYLGKEGCSIDIEWKGAGREYQFTAEVGVTKDSLTIGTSYGTIPEAVCKAALSAINFLRNDK